MNGFLQKAPIVLASSSPARRAMLEKAGLDIIVAPSDVDEDEVKKRFRQERAEASEIAGGLAGVKARAASLKCDHVVIGGDQTLCPIDEPHAVFGKPMTQEGLKAQLSALSGRECHLFSGAAVARGGRVLWRAVGMAQLRYRLLDAAKIEAYAAAEPDAARAAGGFLMERLGPRIISDVEGDPFTILGLPLTDLLSALEAMDVIA